MTLAPAQAMQKAFSAYQRGAWGEAEMLCRQVLAAKADHFDALNLLGIIAARTQRTQDAAELLRRAVAANPTNAGAHSNYGNVLEELARWEQALDSYNQALRLKPDFAEAYNNRGITLKELNRLDEALDSYNQALRLKPNFAEAYNNRGNVLQKLKRLDEALDSFQRALNAEPNLPFVQGTWLHAKMKLCDWSDADDQVARLLARIANGERATEPFPLLALTDSLPLQRKAAEVWTNTKHPPSSALPPIARRNRREKIRIGYFSADFRDHAVSRLMAGVFEAHDRSRFECTAFSYGFDTKDDMRRRVEAAFDTFIDVRNRADRDVAMLAREREVDIAVDLGGFTQGSRTGIFAMRAAPLQASYIGYLGTMGAPYIDYLFADETIIPEDHRPQYTEKLVYLPSYQANDSKRTIAAGSLTRAQLGLPERGFVFCCFNNSYKITPAVFDGWMRILGRVDGSVLFLYADNEWASANLRREAAARGIDGGRLVFGPRLAAADYLARYRAADLFLDTLPYNAGTTASDALWAGLPVLTRIGQSFAGRVAASLLTAIDMPELITTTQEQYEALAVELATDSRRLGRVRHKLEQNRSTKPLFDTQLFTRRIESAYVKMYERYQAGLPPDHISVSP